MIAILFAVAGVACWSADLVFVAGMCAGATIIAAIFELEL